VEAEGDADPTAALGPAVRALVARGHSEVTVVVPEGTIGPGEVRSHELPVQPGCYVVVSAPGRAETDLDLYLAVGETPTDRDTGIEPAAEVRACPDEPATLRVSVKAYGRRSRYALALLRAPSRIEGVQALRLEEATASLVARGYRSELLETRAMEEGQPFSETLRVSSGACVAAAVAGAAEVDDVDLFLRDASGRLVASSTGPEPFAAVSRCAASSEETLTLEVVVYHGSGDVTITRLAGAP
jgi:hypothetical protein